MKQSIRELAICGGPPSFVETLHVGRPNLGDRAVLLERIGDILDRRWFTNNGPLVQELERRLANQFGVKHCIAMCNATVGLEITIRAAQLDGEVIVPAFTFVATAHALQWQEITPVFCDIDPVTHNIDPDKIERLITPKTTGIIGVHLWGRACAVAQLQEIADRFGLKLLFDAAHAFGCSYKGKHIGGFGDAEVFSFHATKVMNAFEGGAVATNDDELASRIRLMNNFGFSGLDNVRFIGTNGKMSEPSAAMALTSLESMDRFVAANKANYRAYQLGFENIPGIEINQYEQQETNNYHYVVLEISERQFGLSRDQVLHVLHQENVRARRYFYPGVHLMEPYRSHYPNAGVLLPVTNSITQKTLCLPTGTAVEIAEVEKICALMRLIAAHSNEIKEILEESE